MKKLFNSRFLFILASSLVVLILLTVGAFYLFDDEDDTFVKSGYVLNPLSTTVEKYFFDENVGYKENLSSMVEFKDVDDNTVSILRDSFIHYMDESISFLKNGAILDLDSVSGDKAVAFYNITDESIIEKVSKGYVIESANGDIELNNFIGRISDNKYIVVGNLNLKMAGNSTMVKGDYFEIVYVEEGIVNIENKNVKYQVAAADTLIYVGNDKVINLGDKKITVDEEDVMSITSITIDGNENIEIVPKAPDEDGSGGSGGSGSGTGNGDGSGSGTGSGEGAGGSGSGTGDGTGEGTGDGSGSGGSGTGGTGNEGVEGEETDDLTVSLKEVSIGSTNVDVIFDVVKKVSIGAVVALIVVTAFLIANTIKLAIFSRKTEIEIMRLVGASNISIKIPFLIEGSFIGFFGAIIPIILMGYGYNSFYNFLGGKLFSSSLGELVAPFPFIIWSSLLLLLIGLLVGMFGSSRAVKKYLKI